MKVEDKNKNKLISRTKKNVGMICNITTYPKPGAGNVEVVLGMAGFISRVKDNAGISTVDKTNITAGQEVNKITELVVTKE